MGRFRIISKPLIFAVFAAMLYSCAQVVAPTGGEKDSEGPQLVGTVPHSGARNFMGREVQFYFNEFLKPGNYANEVFISPIPKVKPEIIVLNKRLTVRFKEPLLPNTTYVITLGKDIKDFNEANKMSSSFTYAFSTGDVLDTLSFSGKIQAAWANANENEMTVMLFDEKDVVSDSIFGKAPLYAVETDNEGAFKFQYLRKGRFKIYAVKDADNNFSFSQLSERIAIADSPLVDLTDTATLSKKFFLRSFLTDDKGPVVKNVKWASDDQLHIEFGEELLDTFQGRYLEMVLVDTADDKRYPLKQLRYRKGDKRHLYALSPQPRNRRWVVQFTNVMDTLGHGIDTSLTVDPEVFAKEDRGRFFRPTYQDYEQQNLVLPSQVKLGLQVDTSVCYIQDSTGKKLGINPLSNGMDILFPIAKAPDPAMDYKIVIKEQFLLGNGKPIDSLIEIPVRFEDMTKTGAMSGIIEGDSSQPGMNYVVILTGPPGKTAARGEKAALWTKRIHGPGPFRVTNMPEGAYTVKIIVDEDNNGFLTPGSLFPYKMPEKMLTGFQQIDIKASWELKNYKITCVQPKVSDRMAGNKTKPGSEEEPKK